MQEISPKVEEFKRRVREKYPRRSEPNFRIPWYILVVNMLLIAYILYIYTRRQSDDPYQVTLQYGGAEYHLSIIRDVTTGDKIASLAVRNLMNNYLSLRFDPYLASLEFYHGKKMISSEKIGDGITSLVCGKGESRTFTIPVPLHKLIEYARRENEKSGKRKKSLITVEPNYFSYTVRLIVHTGIPVATIFEYRIYDEK
ncbi:MAG: hypothetical protein N2316_10460 [Spirochaetes bacterium]|nr:hypothetical protein [Spirochaetota bacterium]